MTRLRRAALVALLCGHVGAWSAGVLPASALVLAVLVTPLAAWGSHRLSTVPARRVASALALALALLAVRPVLAGGGEAGLRGVLGPLLVGVTAVQPLTWHRPREVQTGLLAALGLLVLGASFAPDVLVGLPLLVGWGALLVAGVRAGEQRHVQGADVVVPGTGSRVGVVPASALAAVLGLVLFLLLPVPADAGVASRLAAQAAATSGRGAPGAYTGSRVDLRLRGDLSDRPVLQVPADSPALWRSGVYPTWDGSSWSTQARRQPVRDGRVSATTAPVRTDRVQVERRALGVVFAPGPIVAVEPGPVVVDEFGGVAGPMVRRYAVTSQVVTPSDDALAAATGADVDDPRWTDLPSSVPARVGDLGRSLTAGAGSRIDAVRRVERYLAANASYRLDSPVPGPGEDAVDRFLFVDRVGFCEQFAAAEVLLLRASGIPARFVTGLAYGQDAGDGRRTFRDRDLHAWVEVFHAGVGWVASDPTPPATQLASASLGTRLRVRMAAELTVLLRRAESVPGGRPALGLGLLLATAAVAAPRLRGLRRVRTTRTAVPRAGTGGPALSAFLRFDQSLGAAARRPDETLLELADRLPPELAPALGVVSAECYAPLPPADLAAAVRTLDATRP